jgi:hypothetical protein
MIVTLSKFGRTFRTIRFLGDTLAN